MFLTVWIDFYSALPIKISQGFWFEYLYWLPLPPGPYFPPVSPVKHPLCYVKKWGSMIYVNSAGKNFWKKPKNFPSLLEYIISHELEIIVFHLGLVA
jgi:hypothetical protein